MITTDLSILRKKNEKVNPEEMSELINKLEYELLNSPNHGVGLAAPQIGINKSIAIVRININGQKENIDLVNPKIIDYKYPIINMGEGCLSFPDKSFNTQRYKEIVIIDDLHPSGFVALEFVSLVLQHETDHVDGILITDRALGNKIGRNDPCPCGKIINNKVVKFKHCHGK